MHRISFLLLLVFCFTATGKVLAATVSAPEKFIRISVDQRGYAYVGKDTPTIIELTDEIRIRLWKSFLGTGKMPKAILVSYAENAGEANKTATEKALKEGLQKALQQLCVHKFKKKYDDIGKNQQQKLKKQFPVLFQQLFTTPES